MMHLRGNGDGEKFGKISGAKARKSNQARRVARERCPCNLFLNTGNKK
jgi:hypothetical protein